MPENIFKIYPPKKGPSKDGRRGSGLWSEDDPKKRFQHVKKVLDLYYDDDTFFDDRDLAWFLKNAVIGNLYFSEVVVNGIRQEQYWPMERINEGIKNDINDIIEGNLYKNDGSFREELLQVRKWLGEKYHKKGASPLVFEHVVPAKVYLEELKKLYINTYSFKDSCSQKYFEEFRKKVAVCIVTKDQDDALNRAKLRESMPDEWAWENGDLFARYKSEKLGEKEIQIHVSSGK